MKWKVGDRFVVKQGLDYSNCAYGAYEQGDIGIIKSIVHKDVLVDFDKRHKSNLSERIDYSVKIEEIEPLTKLHKALL